MKRHDRNDRAQHVTRSSGTLNPRQVRFVEEYLVDLSATRAAIRAGYSERTARQIGHRLLTNVDIAAAIEAEQLQRSREMGITREKVLKEMAAIAFSDIRKLFDEEGRLLPIEEIPEELAPSIAAFEVDLVRHEESGETYVTVTTKVKLWDKGKQLDNLLKHLGMDAEKSRGRRASPR